MTNFDFSQLGTRPSGDALPALRTALETAHLSDPGALRAMHTELRASGVTVRMITCPARTAATRVISEFRPDGISVNANVWFIRDGRVTGQSSVLMLAHDAPGWVELKLRQALEPQNLRAGDQVIALLTDATMGGGLQAERLHGRYGVLTLN